MTMGAHIANVLLVEDDASRVNIIRDYLGRAGFHVNVVANGWEALKRIKLGHSDLIISEINVADMDGCSLREKCVLNPETRDTPFLFLVPEGKSDNQVRALRAGVDDCITVPFDPVVLVARVQAVLERRHAYDRLVRLDPLTRLLNRPTLEGELSTELQRVVRYGRFATMVLLDIENFEQVNTEAGTSMGDLLLTCLAGVILTNIRTIDLAGRFRGEKFLLYLPETDATGAETLTRRIQKQLAAIADTVAAYPLTIACGVVEAPAAGNDLPSLIKSLNEAVAEAKKQGKGGLHVWRA